MPISPCGLLKFNPPDGCNLCAILIYYIGHKMGIPNGMSILLFYKTRTTGEFIHEKNRI